jgi:thymidine kinase
MERIAIFPKDISIILGRSERYGRDLIVKIKKKNNKLDYQVVTIDEFCTFSGLNYEEVKNMINKRCVSI